MKHVFFIAGESSGDMHGANLIRALRSADPDIQCAGLGGVRMADAGMELVYDLAGDAIMGFVEVLKKALPIRRLFLDTLERLRRDPPDCLVLIDYPGFNIRFAKAVYELGIPVVYYISPQVWAWKRKRLHTLAQVVRKMLVIFPFEEELYRDQGVDCVYVGHPLADQVAQYTLPAVSTQERMTIGLLPGSREQEIRRIVPVMAEVGAGILEEYPEAQFLVPCINETRAQQARTLFGDLPVDLRVGGMYDVLSQSRCCLVASGTATIETALFGVPMGIMYRVNPISYYLARMLVHIRYIGMVNILAERQIAPEFIQHTATVDHILPFMLDIIKEGEVRNRMLADLREIRVRLGGRGASRRAAEQILQLLG
ncbi:MAG: lipid-A-disaccharide synthase [Candidatus Hydrogenedentes bacterium]|nr:lipid-A-disaccharide synthase [Candidatus Hydrogenedentota bacterium]